MVRPYHHGNLRVTLIVAACDLIAKKGPHGFTLAEAAKIAGVSAAAPYRHFPSKDDLVLAIVEQGFAAFASELKAARKSNSDPMTALINMGHAYLQFAYHHQGEYMAMFESGVRSQNQPPPNIHAFAELLVGSEAFMRIIQSKNKPNFAEVAQHIWALSHGVASLFARNSPDPDALKKSETILENGIHTYLKGLEN